MGSEFDNRLNIKFDILPDSGYIKGRVKPWSNPCSKSLSIGCLYKVISVARFLIAWSSNTVKTFDKPEQKTALKYNFTLLARKPEYLCKIFKFRFYIFFRNQYKYTSSKTNVALFGHTVHNCLEILLLNQKKNHTGWPWSYRKSVLLFCASVLGRLRD